MSFSFMYSTMYIFKYGIFNYDCIYLIIICCNNLVLVILMTQRQQRQYQQYHYFYLFKRPWIGYVDYNKHIAQMVLSLSLTYTGRNGAKHDASNIKTAISWLIHRSCFITGGSNLCRMEDSKDKSTSQEIPKNETQNGWTDKGVRWKFQSLEGIN